MNFDLQTLQAFLARAPFVVDVGIEAVAVDAGGVTTALQLRPRHLQHTGQVHAGVIVTMADHSMGAAAQAFAPEGQWIVTAELKTSLMRAANGERLVCLAQVLKAGRQLSFTEAEVWVESGAQRTLVAKASATMARVAARP